MPLVVLVLAGFFSRVGYQMARSPVLPRFAQDLGAAPELIGLIVAASTITGVIIKLPAGALSDLLGRRRMILTGLFLCAVTLPAIPTFTVLWLLFAVSALFGLGVAIVTPSTTALVADLVKARRMGSAMEVFGTIWDSGEAMGPILAGILIGTLSYRPAFGLIAAFMATIAVVFLVTVRDPTASVAEERVA